MDSIQLHATAFMIRLLVSILSRLLFPNPDRDRDKHDQFLMSDANDFAIMLEARSRGVV